MTPQGSSKKRRLSQVERDDGLDNDEIPGSASAKRPRSRKLAFHPDVVDNSLWADIHVAKRPGEFYGLDRQLPTSTAKPEKSLSESYMDPSSSEDSPDTDKENTPPPDDFGDRPTTSFLSMRGTPDPVSNLNSKERSASILRSVAKVGSTSESSREVPDVETLHRSPLPGARRKMLPTSQPEGEGPAKKKLNTREAMAIRLQGVKRLPFPGFVKPPNYDTLLSLAKAQVNEEPDFDPFAKPPLLKKPLSADEIADFSFTLMKRIGDDREAKNAFAKLMAWRGQLGYDAGYQDGIREQVTQLVRQAMENNRDSPP